MIIGAGSPATRSRSSTRESSHKSRRCVSSASARKVLICRTSRLWRKTYSKKQETRIYCLYGRTAIVRANTLGQRSPKCVGERIPVSG